MKFSQSAILATPLSAWRYPGTNDIIFGTPDNSSTTLESISHPNLTKTADFKFGTQTWQLRVNVTNFTPVGADTELKDPRAVWSTYDISWPGGKALREAVIEAEALDPDQVPALWYTAQTKLFTAKQTNGYKGDGDCAGVVGQDCVDSLVKHAVSDFSDTIDFSKCPKELDNGGGYAGAIDSKYNHTAFDSPYPAFSWVSDLSNGDDSNITKAFARESERVHMLIISSGVRSYPVCIRIKDDNVKSGDPSVSGGSRFGMNPWYSGALVVGLLAYLL